MSRIKLPRGVRNNNPLNIRRNKKQMWVGEVAQLEHKNGAEIYTERDRFFCQFKDLIFGWRAAFITLHTYIVKHKCNTIEKIITRWAPPSENNTTQYINNVSFFSLIYPDAELDFYDKIAMIKIAAAMCIVENGTAFDPIKADNTLAFLDAGYESALCAIRAKLKDAEGGTK